jgi:hypothetical protein
MFLHSPTPATPNAVPPSDMRWSFLAITLLGGLFLYWVCGRLKKVTLSGDAVLVSNFFQTARLPLADVIRVSASRLLSPETVWLRLARPSSFGTSIAFIPRRRFTLGLTEHPIAAEIRRSAEEARRHLAGAPIEESV